MRLDVGRLNAFLGYDLVFAVFKPLLTCIKVKPSVLLLLAGIATHPPH